MTIASAIDRYIARKVLVPLVATLLLAAMLLLLEKMLRLFDFVVSEGGPVAIVWRLLANLIPEYMGLGIPLGLIMGILLAFRGLAISSELDAMRSAGLGYGRLLRMPYVFAAVLMATNIVIVGYIQPISEYAYQRLEFELRSGALGASIRVGEFVPLGDDMTLRVENSVDNGRILEGVFMRVDTPRRRVAVTADTGTFLASDEAGTILLRVTNGRLVHDEPGFRVPRVLSFASYDFPINLPMVETFRARGIGEEELTLTQLVRVFGSRETASDERNRTRANFHFRLAEVLIMALLPLMAVALAVPPKRSTSGLGMFIGIVFVVAAHKLFQYGEGVAAIGLVSPLVSIWVPFALLATLIVWMYWTLAHKPGGQPIGALERAFGKVAGAARRLTRRSDRGRPVPEPMPEPMPAPAE